MSRSCAVRILCTRSGALWWCATESSCQTLFRGAQCAPPPADLALRTPFHRPRSRDTAQRSSTRRLEAPTARLDCAPRRRALCGAVLHARTRGGNAAPGAPWLTGDRRQIAGYVLRIRRLLGRCSVRVVTGFVGGRARREISLRGRDRASATGPAARAPRSAGTARRNVRATRGPMVAPPRLRGPRQRRFGPRPTSRTT